jgi:hypothetical protein
MAIKILSTKDVHTNGIKLVLYGASGTGKTRMGATAPNPVFISAEKGLLSLAHLDIPYLEVKTLKSLDEAYNYVVKSEFETIVIDSLSEVTQNILDQTKKTMISESSSGKIDARQAYGKIAESVGNMIRNFRDIDGKNVVFIAKERKVEDESSGVITFEAYLPGRVLPFDLPYLVDEVLCLQIDRKGERFLQTQPDRKRVCKDRSDQLSEFERPDLTKIFNKIKGVK